MGTQVWGLWPMSPAPCSHSRPQGPGQRSQTKGIVLESDWSTTSKAPWPLSCQMLWVHTDLDVTLIICSLISRNWSDRKFLIACLECTNSCPLLVPSWFLCLWNVLELKWDPWEWQGMRRQLHIPFSLQKTWDPLAWRTSEQSWFCSSFAETRLMSADKWGDSWGIAANEK